VRSSVHKINGSQSLAQFCLPQTSSALHRRVFSLPPSTRFAQVTTCVFSLLRGIGGEEWVEWAMGHRAWSCIVQTWTTFCFVFNPARTFGAIECCLEPFLSSRSLALWQKRITVTSRAHRSLTVPAFSLGLAQYLSLTFVFTMSDLM